MISKQEAEEFRLSSGHAARQRVVEKAVKDVRDGSAYVRRAANPTSIGSLNNLGKEVHQFCREQGFYDHEFVYWEEMPILNPSLPAEKVALLGSEASEILEALRSGDKEEEALEAADVLIRLVDYCYWRKIDLDAAVEAKMAKNRTRPRLHGRKF
jgi:NTP pyrophosphatase (non-canonical NTP hydrolase)